MADAASSSPTNSAAAAPAAAAPAAAHGRAAAPPPTLPAAAAAARCDDGKDGEDGESSPLLIPSAATIVAAACGGRVCPWCQAVCVKDDACNWVCCGLVSGSNRFFPDFGCGHQWCFACAKKLCGRLYQPPSATQRPGVSINHTATCCPATSDFCVGGHNSHKPPSTAAAATT